MNALDLIQIGRQLIKLGEEALRDSKANSFPTGPTLVLRDVFANQDASINEIAERTRLPQSYVSESVTKLRDRGLVETKTDPSDKRRTLVRVSNEHRRAVAQRGAVSVDATVTEALGEAPAEASKEVLEALNLLAERLRPAVLGPILEQLCTEREHGPQPDA